MYSREPIHYAITAVQTRFAFWIARNYLINALVLLWCFSSIAPNHHYKSWRPLFHSLHTTPLCSFLPTYLDTLTSTLLASSSTNINIAWIPYTQSRAPQDHDLRDASALFKKASLAAIQFSVTFLLYFPYCSQASLLSDICNRHAATIMAILRSIRSKLLRRLLHWRLAIVMCLLCSGMLLSLLHSSVWLF